jgi:signal transduction histidine kinase
LRHAPEDLLAPADFTFLVLRLYEQWRLACPPGRTRSIYDGHEPQPDGSLLISHGTPTHLAALLTAPDWLAANLKHATSSDIRWTWFRSRRSSAGGELRAIRSLYGLGELEFSFISITADQGLNHRGLLWLTGIALMLLLVLTGAYAIHRGVNQELRVAQLQADFVAAVSHEFRSPLTTLCTITELLVQDRICDESRRRQSYRFLERETSRLQRLVEDLLDFGRMESGRKQYRIEPRDVFRLVHAVVADFREEALADGFQIEIDLDPSTPTAKVDEEALRRAIRNLLENAVKYSPECRTIWVDGVVNQQQVAISIRDRGMGIEPHEQNEIFQKFARGLRQKRLVSKVLASDCLWCSRSLRPSAGKYNWRAPPAQAALLRLSYRW